jgi:hypothetical protein
MTVDDFIALASAQPEVTQCRPIRVWGPSLRAEVEAGRLRNLVAIQSHPDQHDEIRTVRYGHRLGPGLTAAELDEWQRQAPEFRLPHDLASLLLRINGIHLWADLDHERAYWGVAPLHEWRSAALQLGSQMSGISSQATLVLSYHENGDSYLLLDTAASCYRWLDTEDVDASRIVGTRVSQLLDWLWEEARNLAPDGPG